MRALIYFLVFAVLSCVMLYLASGVVLGKVSNMAIDYFMARARIPNIEYTRPSFSGVRITSFNTVTWYDVSSYVRFAKDVSRSEFKDFAARIEKVSIRFGGLLSDKVEIVANKFVAEEIDSEGRMAALMPILGDRLEADGIRIGLKLDITAPKRIPKEMDEVIEEFKNFMKNGEMKIPIQLSGEEKITFEGKIYTARVWVKREGDEYRLVMDEDDIKKMGNLGGRTPPTDTDIKIIARNPLRAPEMVRIRNKAETTARDAHMKDPSIPEDAYRHTLWAYLLTKAFGDKFAREVTGAHELTADSRESRGESGKPILAARQQDYANNAAGIYYATAGYPESDVLRLVMSDSMVVRDKIAKNK